MQSMKISLLVFQKQGKYIFLNPHLWRFGKAFVLHDSGISNMGLHQNVFMHDVRVISLAM